METLQTIWNWYGVIVFVALAWLIFLAWLDLRREPRELPEVDYLGELYHEIWTGREEDRIAAWFRTIEHLKNWNYDKRLIAEATDRMNRLKVERSKRSYVDSNGRLIEKTEIK